MHGRTTPGNKKNRRSTNLQLIRPAASRRVAPCRRMKTTPRWGWETPPCGWAELHSASIERVNEPIRIALARCADPSAAPWQGKLSLTRPCGKEQHHAPGAADRLTGGGLGARSFRRAGAAAGGRAPRRRSRWTPGRMPAGIFEPLATGPLEDRGQGRSGAHRGFPRRRRAACKAAAVAWPGRA